VYSFRRARCALRSIVAADVARAPPAGLYVRFMHVDVNRLTEYSQTRRRRCGVAHSYVCMKNNKNYNVVQGVICSLL